MAPHQNPNTKISSSGPIDRSKSRYDDLKKHRYVLFGHLFVGSTSITTFGTNKGCLDIYSYMPARHIGRGPSWPNKQRDKGKSSLFISQPPTAPDADPV
jgi:hypothetical protein